MNLIIDRVLAMLPTHATLVSAGRGIDKLENQSFTKTAIERSSIELYCRTSDGLSIVKNMLSVSYHKYLRENIAKVNAMLQFFKLNAGHINPSIRRQVVLDRLFTIRREYCYRRSERLSAQKAQLRLSEISTDEAKAFIRGTGEQFHDPIVLRLLEAVGPTALETYVPIHTHTGRAARRHSLMGPLINPHTHQPVVQHTPAEIQAQYVEAVCRSNPQVNEALQHHIEVKKRREICRVLLLLNSLTPEIITDILISIMDRSTSAHRMHVLRQLKEHVSVGSA
jgi:hypothetical protein